MVQEVPIYGSRRHQEVKIVIFLRISTSIKLIPNSLVMLLLYTRSYMTGQYAFWLVIKVEFSKLLAGTDGQVMIH